MSKVQIVLTTSQYLIDQYSQFFLILMHTPKGATDWINYLRVLSIFRTQKSIDGFLLNLLCTYIKKLLCFLLLQFDNKGDGVGKDMIDIWKRQIGNDMTTTTTIIRVWEWLQRKLFKALKLDHMETLRSEAKALPSLHISPPAATWWKFLN